MIDFAEFTPDQPVFMGGAGEALNVFPSERGYRPMPSVSTVTNALTARCQGAAYFRDSSGNATVFAGDATKLYLLSSATYSDVSRLSGGAYTIGGDDQWDFAQFGTLVIATNGSDAPQKWTLGSSANFSALGGSPPSARFVEVMGDFVVMARTNSSKVLVQWSAINNAEDYAASAATQSDSQTIPDGGDITGLLGYEYGGLVFQERAIRRMDYEGSPIIFRFRKISEGVGATISGSIAGYADRAFFVHRSGFFMVLSGAQVVPIGAGKVDRYFWADVDTTYLSRISAAVDPVNKLYAILYCSGGSATPNHMLLYHWDSNRWARATPGNLDLIWSGTAQSAVTIDTIDSYGNIDTLPFSLDSAVWTGVPQPLFSAFDSTHAMGFFNGSNLAATIDSMEGELSPGRLTLVRAVRSMVETSTSCAPMLALGYRNRLNDAVTFGSAMAQDPDGKHPFNVNARYARARLTLASGQDWSHAIGIDVIDSQQTGMR